MAKASKQPREASLPLIIALVFFILTTIGLGVFCYVLNSDQAAKDDAVNKAKKDVTDARAVAKDWEHIARVNRIVAGTDEASGDDSDLKVVMAELKEGTKGYQELKRINDLLKRKAPALAKDVADKFNARLEKDSGIKLDGSDLVKENDFAFWPATAGTKGIEPPTGNLLDVTIRARAVRDLAVKQSNADNAAYAGALKLIKDAADSYKKASGEFAKKSIDLPEDFKKQLDKLNAAADKRRADYDKDTANAMKANEDLQTKIDALSAQRKRIDDDIARLKNDLFAERKKNEQKIDPFQFDEPQGKILRRLPDGMVEIDVGSSALVQPGLTFTVLPYDFPQKGRQSRMQKVRVQDDRGRFKDAEVFTPKATIEVTEVLGPNLSRARVTSVADDLREPPLTGDLLYNSVWRKGQADHIALIGIFDINGDGVDDIEAVVRELTKMGIPVDAYFNLKTQKWQGRLTERTRMVVEGYQIPNSELDPNRDAKTKLINALGGAKKEATDRSINVVSFRDFFPRIGYKAKTDVTEDKINHAVARYIGGINAVEMPPGSDK